MGKFGISQPVLRREDARLLTGGGQFVDDLRRPALARGFMLRSPHGHARIAAIEVTAARQAPGVLAIYTGADLRADGIGPIPAMVKPTIRPGSRYVEHGQPILVDDTVRFVGDCVAFVVAETVDQARDAAELIEIDYAPLPTVTECDVAAGPGAPPVWPDAPNNVCFEWETGDKAATDAAFARAAHVARLDLVNNRVVLNAIETRGAIGEWDAAAGKFTLTTGTQMPNPMKTQLVRDVFKTGPDDVRVVVGDVGGGFGGKNSLFPEQAMVLYAARKLGRAVKWIGERSDAFVSDYHGRDNVTRGEMAFDETGRMLAVRVSTYADLGAYTAARGTVSPVNGVLVMINTYRIPTIYVEVRGVYTNKVPTDPYRGAGRPEVIYMLERLVDIAALQLGIDRVALRRLNFIPPEAFPYPTPTGLTYDSGEFDRIMTDALAQSSWDGIEERRAEAAARGKLRGIGMANYIERCGGGGGLSEHADLAFDADGGLTVTIGSMDNGQGHFTAYSQIVNQWLGLPFDKIRLVQGDTDLVATGTGTGGSWSVPMGGGAICLAADVVIEKARRLAAHLLEAAAADLTFADGQFTVAGTDLSISLEAVARASFDPALLPPESEPGLEGAARFTPENHTFPYGCHICEVEIDRDTGWVEIVGYTAVHDFGRALNPLLLAGQVHGGVAQGIGQALMELTAYDEDGQLLSGSFMDYRLPRADDLPAFRFVARETATSRNPLGIKGCGEAGATGSPPAVINAIVDALAPFGVSHLDMPATPEKVWRAMHAGNYPSDSR